MMDDRTRRSRTPARDHHHARENITLGSRVLRRGVAQFGDDVTQLRCFVYVIAYLKFLRIKSCGHSGRAGNGSPTAGPSTLAGWVQKTGGVGHKLSLGQVVKNAYKFVRLSSGLLERGLLLL